MQYWPSSRWFDINSSSITGHHHNQTMSETHETLLLLREIIIILSTQSTAVLLNHLNDKLKLLCWLQFFPEVVQNTLSFPHSEKSQSIPGLWPRSLTLPVHQYDVLNNGSAWNRLQCLWTLALDTVITCYYLSPAMCLQCFDAVG